MCRRKTKSPDADEVKQGIEAVGRGVYFQTQRLSPFRFFAAVTIKRVWELEVLLRLNVITLNKKNDVTSCVQFKTSFIHLLYLLLLHSQEAG